MHRRWLSASLLSTCVSAFYPYWEEGQDKQKRFIPLHLDGSSEGGVITADLKKVESKRDNTFPVVLSNNPDEQNAIAIHQDGQDYSYIASMKFGSKGKELYMLIDTGSANTWVMGSDCTSDSCSLHNTLGPKDSTTLDVSKKTWSLAYGTGTVTGVVAEDKVDFATYSVTMGFGLVTTASDDFNNYPMDGIMGLGRPSSSELDTPTLMEVLDEQAALKDNILGIHLQRASDGAKDGQLTFGGVDSTKFKGDLSYTTVIQGNSWEIPADDAGIDGKTCGFKGKSAIVDTGTSYILMPPADAKALHDLIPGSAHNGEIYQVPCDTKANVEITFSKVTYSVSPKDYIGQQNGALCNSNIIGHQAFGENQWILGDVFLKNVYTAFDFDNDRIGFGTMSGTPSSAVAVQSSTTTASTTSTASSLLTTLSTATRASTATAAVSSAVGGGSPFDVGPASSSSDSTSSASSSKSIPIYETRSMVTVLLFAFLSSVFV